MSKIHRLNQVVKYGWKHAVQISNDYFAGKKRISLFIDVFGCYRKYGMWSNQYLKERFWELDKKQRSEIGSKYYDANQRREIWVKDFYENRAFYIKYGNIKYEKESLRAKRNAAYTKRYQAGKNLFVEYDVNISRQHYLNGTIAIGDDVLLAKHVFIDYSGSVVIHNDVAIANGVVIETHTHPIEKKGGEAIPGHLEIESGVKILSNSYIADTCHSIGRHARIGAGSYVRTNIPPYAIVIGNPAKIIGFLYTPKEVFAFEEERYPESERIPLEVLEHNYQKYFLSKIKDIKEFVKL